MRGVDLSIFRFHYDLTFCALLMNADGATYHVYGGRDHEDAERHLSLETLQEALLAGLRRHRSRLAQGFPSPTPTEAKEGDLAESLPFIKARMAKRPNDCIHCHTVTDALHEQRRARGTFTQEDLWQYPEPQKVGLVMDPEAPHTVQAVLEDSPAAQAGIQADERLVTLQISGVSPPPSTRMPSMSELGIHPLETFGDITHALEAIPRKGGTFKLMVHGDDGPRSVQLVLAPGWRKQTPAEFAWRPALWRLRPQPGFGGPELDAEQKKAHGLEEDAFAFRIQYLVTWGERAHVGRSARKAGLRKNDVVLSVGGKSDFESTAHFHAWFRFTREEGETLKVEVLRGKKKLTLDLPVVP